MKAKFKSTIFPDVYGSLRTDYDPFMDKIWNVNGKVVTGTFSYEGAYRHGQEVQVQLTLGTDTSPDTMLPNHVTAMGDGVVVKMNCNYKGSYQTSSPNDTGDIF